MSGAQGRSGKKLARAAEEALQKIETVLPPRLKSKLVDSALMAPAPGRTLADFLALMAAEERDRSVARD